MTTYTLTGSVRGNCGHQHRTIEAAAKCAHKDSRRCREQGGYSDRTLVVIEDGERRGPDDAEHLHYCDQIDHLIHAGRGLRASFRY